MICTAAKFDGHANARQAQRGLQRNYGISTYLRHCEACDGYHLTANCANLRDSRGYKLPKKALQVLNLSAQGFNTQEIATQAGLTYNTVEWYSKSLIRAFHAMNGKHLIAIAISLGLISPNDFVPQIKPPMNERTNSGDHSGNIQGHDLHRYQAGHGVPDGAGSGTRKTVRRTAARTS